MIIWINGAFGSGKTQTAYELNKLIPDSIVFDPEETGFFIGRNIPKSIHKSDFQEYEIWRTINRQIIEYIGKNFKGIIICPMTVTKPEYLNEITSGFIEVGIKFKHVCLVASEETLRKRLKKRGEKKNSWGEQQIKRCVNSLSNECFSEHVFTDDMSIDRVVYKVASICKISLTDDNRSSLRKRFDRIMIWMKHMRIFG